MELQPFCGKSFFVGERDYIPYRELSPSLLVSFSDMERLWTRWMKCMIIGVEDAATKSARAPSVLESYSRLKSFSMNARRMLPVR